MKTKEEILDASGIGGSHWEYRDKVFKAMEEYASLKLKEQAQPVTEEEIRQAAKDCAFNMYDIVDGTEIPWAKNKYEGDIGVKFFIEGWRQSHLPKQQEEKSEFKIFRFPHEEAQSPESANLEQNPMMATIHLSGDHGNNVSEAAQIIFFKYKDGKLGVEVYPTEELQIFFKMNSPISFNLSSVARGLLMRFLNNKENEY